MSPEQVRGAAVDCRTDIFSFGAVLYEMLSGVRAFQRDTTAETMTAILHDDPPETPTGGRPIPPALDRIVHHCLEKAPEQRFQSARDMAFDLESVTTLTASGGLSAAKVKERKTRTSLIAAAAALGAARRLGRMAALFGSASRNRCAVSSGHLSSRHARHCALHARRTERHLHRCLGSRRA